MVGRDCRFSSRPIEIISVFFVVVNYNWMLRRCSYLPLSFLTKPLLCSSSLKPAGWFIINCFGRIHNSRSRPTTCSTSLAAPTVNRLAKKCLQRPQISLILALTKKSQKNSSTKRYLRHWKIYGRVKVLFVQPAAAQDVHPTFTWPTNIFDFCENKVIWKTVLFIASFHWLWIV